MSDRKLSEKLPDLILQYPRGKTSMVESAFNNIAGEDSD